MWTSSSKKRWRSSNLEIRPLLATFKSCSKTLLEVTAPAGFESSLIEVESFLRKVFLVQLGLETWIVGASLFIDGFLEGEGS